MRIKSLEKFARKEYLRFKVELGNHTSLSGSLSLMVTKNRIRIYGDQRINFSSKGVKGHGRGGGSATASRYVDPKTPYSFKGKNPPANVMKRYNTRGNKGGEFAIAKSVGKHGIHSKKYIEKATEKTFLSNKELNILATSLAHETIDYLLKID